MYSSLKTSCLGFVYEMVVVSSFSLGVLIVSKILLLYKIREDRRIGIGLAT